MCNTLQKCFLISLILNGNNICCKSRDLSSSAGTDLSNPRNIFGRASSQGERVLQIFWETGSERTDLFFSCFIILFLTSKAFPGFISLLCYSLLCLKICLFRGLGLLEDFSNWIQLSATHLHLCLIGKIIDSVVFSDATQWQPCICKSCKFACSQFGSCLGQPAPSPALCSHMSCPRSPAPMTCLCTGNASALDTAKTI